MAVAGFYMIKTGEPGGWLVLIFFGLMSLIGLLALAPGSTFLRLEPEGFTVSTLYRRVSFRWSDVEKFGVFEIDKSSFVGFNLKPAARKKTFWRKLSSRVSGWHAELRDTFGMSSEELAQLMNERREKYEVSE